MAQQEFFEYRIQAGDTLSMIIAKMFGVSIHSARYKVHLNYILELNPGIKNPNHIHSGEILRLGIIPSTKKLSIAKSNPQPFQPNLAPPKPKESILSVVPPHNLDDFRLLSWLAQNSNYLTVPGGIAVGAKGNLLSPGNINLIENISNGYADYKAGKMTRGQYNYFRKTSLDQLKNNIGPLEKWLFGGQTPHEAVRIARGGGVPATSHITRHASRLNKLAAVGKAGGYVLVGVGLTASCMQIADAQSSQDKNEIFVETVASTTVGLVSGAVIGLFLVSNPIGWGTALIIATGSVAVGYMSGKAARKAYTLSGTDVDLVTGSGVSLICK